jgi:hypothetical protein
MSLRCREMGWGLFAGNILRGNGVNDHAKGDPVSVKSVACTLASPKCAAPAHDGLMAAGT